jgi:ParB family chromosome partitioning protein
MLEFSIIAFLAMLPFIMLPRVIDSGTGQASQTVRKPASWIKPQKQIRTDYGTEAEQRSFGESVKAMQLQPLVCLADGTLVCGYRRLHCGMLVGKTEFDVLIIAEELTESQIKVYRLTENIQRKDLSAWEMYQSCLELMNLNPSWQLRDLAAHLHYDPASITRYLSPSRCVPAWVEALHQGKVGISDCYAASKLPESEQGGMLEFKLSGASRDQLEMAGRKARTSTTTAAKLSRIPVRLPGGVSVVIAGNEMSLDEAIETLAEVLKSAKKARDEGLTAKSWAAAMMDKAKVKV